MWALAKICVTYPSYPRIDDLWCHMSWMKVSVRRDFDNWYVDNNYTQLDYPVVAGYVHYIMSFVYRFYDSAGFYEQSVIGVLQINPLVKMAARRAILSVNILFYYPTVIAVVLLNYGGSKRIVKYGTMLLLMTFPSYFFVENTYTQVNGPHLAFLLWCFHFVLNDRPYLSTIAFTLSFSAKQVSGPVVFPIAVYILAREWQRLSVAIRSVWSSLSFNDSLKTESSRLSGTPSSVSSPDFARSLS